MKDKRWQAEGVVAVEMGQEDNLYVARLHAEPSHVRQQRRAAVEQHLAVDRYSAVVSLRREGRPRAEEGNLQATVTALFRYTSWIAWSRSTPSFIGRWKDLRP